MKSIENYLAQSRCPQAEAGSHPLHLRIRCAPWMKLGDITPISVGHPIQFHHS